MANKGTNIVSNNNKYGTNGNKGDKGNSGKNSNKYGNDGNKFVTRLTRGTIVTW